MNLIETLEDELGKTVVPTVHVGDTVNVHYLIREGDKERVQIFNGTVIAMSGRGIRKTITVRRIVQGEGVERTFPLHGPRVQDVELVRRGEVRRAKLFYLRDRVGKARKLRERRLSAAKKAALEAAAQEQASASAEVVGAAKQADETVAATV